VSCTFPIPPPRRNTTRHEERRQEYGVHCSLSYKQAHGIAYDQKQPDIMVCRNGDLPIHTDLVVANCRRDAKQDTLFMRTSQKEGTTPTSMMASVREVHHPANNSCDQQE
jgi:hypothetical protein